MQLVEATGWEVRAVTPTGLFPEIFDLGGTGKGGACRALRALDGMGVELWPTTFGFRFVVELAPVPVRESQAAEELTGPRGSHA